MQRDVRVGILGAGAIGVHMGARMALGGASVVLVGRQSLLDGLADCAQRVLLRTKKGRVTEIVLGEESGLIATQDPLMLVDCSVIFLCVKAIQLESAAKDLQRIFAEQSQRRLALARIVVCQNGFEAENILHGLLSDSVGKELAIQTCVVNYNVVWSSNLFAATSAEEVHTQGGPCMDAVLQCLQRGGIKCVVHQAEEMKAVMYSKTCTNMANSINALRGVTIKETFLEPDCRSLWALAMEEALAVFRSAGVEPANLTVPLWVFPDMLRAPTWLVSILLLSKVDKFAKGSMLQDLEAGRTQTEAPFLNLAIARLAAAQSQQAPVNLALGKLVEAAAAEGKGSPCMSAQEIARQIGVSPQKLADGRQKVLCALLIMALTAASAVGISVAKMSRL